MPTIGLQLGLLTKVHLQGSSPLAGGAEIHLLGVGGIDIVQGKGNRYLLISIGKGHSRRTGGHRGVKAQGHIGGIELQQRVLKGEGREVVLVLRGHDQLNGLIRRRRRTSNPSRILTSGDKRSGELVLTLGGHESIDSLIVGVRLLYSLIAIEGGNHILGFTNRHLGQHRVAIVEDHRTIGVTRSRLRVDEVHHFRTNRSRQLHRNRVTVRVSRRNGTVARPSLPSQTIQLRSGIGQLDVHIQIIPYAPIDEAQRIDSFHEVTVGRNLITLRDIVRNSLAGGQVRDGVASLNILHKLSIRVIRSNLEVVQLIPKLVRGRGGQRLTSGGVIGKRQHGAVKLFRSGCIGHNLNGLVGVGLYQVLVQNIIPGTANCRVCNSNVVVRSVFCHLGDGPRYRDFHGYSFLGCVGRNRIKRRIRSGPKGPSGSPELIQFNRISRKGGIFIGLASLQGNGQDSFRSLSRRHLLRHRDPLQSSDLVLSDSTRGRRLSRHAAQHPEALAKDHGQHGEKQSAFA